MKPTLLHPASHGGDISTIATAAKPCTFGSDSSARVPGCAGGERAAGTSQFDSGDPPARVSLAHRDDRDRVAGRVACCVLLSLFFFIVPLRAQTMRESIWLDGEWRFAFGHAADVAKDFYFGASLDFSKTGQVQEVGDIAPGGTRSNPLPSMNGFVDSLRRRVDVPYTPGILEARGDFRGTSIVEKVETTGEANSIVLGCSNMSRKSDQTSLFVITARTLDAAGRTVPTAESDVRYRVENGIIPDIGSGNPSSHEQDAFSRDEIPHRRLFNGLAQILVKPDGSGRPIQLRAESDGLQSAELTIPVQGNK